MLQYTSIVLLGILKERVFKNQRVGSLREFDLKNCALNKKHSITTNYI